MLSGKCRIYRIQNAIICSCSKNFIYLRNLIKNLLTITLCHTSCNDQCLCTAILLIFCHLKNILDAFLFRIMDKTTGVDHNDICLLLIIRKGIALIAKDTKHILRIYEILITSERYKQNFHYTSSSSSLSSTKRSLTNFTRVSSAATMVRIVSSTGTDSSENSS